VIYDHRGARLQRKKQFGYIARPAEFEPIDPRPKGDLVDVIGTERVELEPDEDEE
jgi:hypothetical protein